MSTYTVSTPVTDFSGEVIGVYFVHGTAQADDTTDATALAYFRRRGYTVEPTDEQQGSEAAE